MGLQNEDFQDDWREALEQPYGINSLADRYENFQLSEGEKGQIRGLMELAANIGRDEIPVKIEVSKRAGFGDLSLRVTDIKHEVTIIRECQIRLERERLYVVTDSEQLDLRWLAEKGFVRNGDNQYLKDTAYVVLLKDDGSIDARYDLHTDLFEGDLKAYGIKLSDESDIIKPGRNITIPIFADLAVAVSDKLTKEAVDAEIDAYNQS